MLNLKYNVKGTSDFIIMEDRLHIEWSSLTWTAFHMGNNLNPSQSISKTSLLQEEAARRALLCIEVAEQVLSLNHAEEGFVDAAPFPSNCTVYSDRVSTVLLRQDFVCKDQSSCLTVFK
jgi:hypothetical protein|uniref:Uncharacterized protein n=1 Tax=Mus musculus TaxID=10090 RepID=Q8CCY2_MOUSE|nr:unnamed protein product [Mus musculus]BAE22238.1 unnamed protein product [Mus musculus]